MPHRLQTSIDSLQRTLDDVRELEKAVDQAVDILVESLSKGGKVLACGNGGSASDAAHFTSELIGRYIHDRRSFPAICLPAETSALTAIANDYSYEEVFARQVMGFGSPMDTLLVFSSSGNSPNLLMALKAASRIGMHSISLLGRDGGKARGLATVDLVVPGSETSRIQESQKLLLHVLCEMCEARLPKDYNDA